MNGPIGNNSEEVFARSRRLPNYRQWSDNRPGNVGPKPHFHGSRHPLSKLTVTQVIYILMSDLPSVDLARMLGVTSTLVYSIRSGRNWNWL